MWFADLLNFMKNVTKFVCFNALVAALYVVFSMPFGTISTASGLQFRPSEALTVLPALCPYTVVGLTIGCAISNLTSAFGIYDVVLGSLVTLVAGLVCCLKPFKTPYTAQIPPIVLNALLLPLIWFISAGQASIEVYLINAGSLLLTQSVVLYGLGTPLYFFTKKKLLPLLSLEQ